MYKDIRLDEHIEADFLGSSVFPDGTLAVVLLRDHERAVYWCSDHLDTLRAIQLDVNKSIAQLEEKSNGLPR